MRVLVNLTWLRPGRVGGSESYLVRLLSGAFPDRVDVHLALQADLAASHPHLADAHELHSAPAPVSWGRPARVALEATWLERLGRRLHADVVHHAGGTVPPHSGRPAVLTIHDLQYLAFPRYFHPLKRAYLRRVVPSSVRRAAVVATPSRHAAAMVVDRLGGPTEAVEVVPHGLDAPPVPARRADAVPVPVPEPFVVYPAVTWPHKNHEVLLRALATPTLRDVSLVLTGAAGPAEDRVRKLIARLDLEQRVAFLGRVPPDRLDALYRAAVALVFPSRFEGFGAPVVEAWWRDCPVIAADATALPEVVGDAGLLVDPDEPQGWASAVAAVLQPAERARLVAAGRRRAPCFSVERAVAAQVHAWERALDR